MSDRANLDRSSFLDLPAELRCSIYEFHFKHPDPLLLLADGFGILNLYRRPEDHNHDLTTRQSTLSPQHAPSSIVPYVLHRAHQPELQLLRVCRQIHREVASIFYSNDFHILSGKDAHLGFHDTTGRYLNQTSARWLQSIGQHQFFVRELCIDLGNICPLACNCVEQIRGPTFRREDGFLHFGALLQAVWTKNLKMVITFTDQDSHTNIMADAAILFEDHATPTRSACDLKHLNQIVQALCKDALGMKKFRRAIGDVGIKADGSGGVFVFWTPGWQANAMAAQIAGPGEHNPLLDHARYLNAQRDGTLCFADTNPRGLLDLPRSVLMRVVEHTLCSQIPCEIDLDSFVDFRDLFGILYADMGIHNRHIGAVLREHTFELSMMTTNMQADFEFGKLRRLLQTMFEYIPTACRKLCRVQFGTYVDYTINLHIHAVETSAFQIRKIRQDVVKVLEQYVKRDHAIDVWVRCPEIWINGHGEIVDVVCTGSLQGDGLVNPAKTDRVMWSALETGYVGAKEPDVPDEDGLARSMYLYLKWISV